MKALSAFSTALSMAIDFYDQRRNLSQYITGGVRRKTNQKFVCKLAKAKRPEIIRLEPDPYDYGVGNVK